MALRDIKSKKPKGGIQVGNIANTKYYKMPDGSIVDDQGKLAPAAFAQAFGDVTPAAKPKIQIKKEETLQTLISNIDVNSEKSLENDIKNNPQQIIKILKQELL